VVGKDNNLGGRGRKKNSSSEIVPGKISGGFKKVHGGGGGGRALVQTTVRIHVEGTASLTPESY